MQDKRFGYFDDDNREYVITDPKTPWPWINYLAMKISSHSSPILPELFLLQGRQVPPHHPLPLQQRADGQRGTLLLHQ